MRRVTAVVKNGRLSIDEPSDLPEGTELELQSVDPGDDLDDSERAALHASIDLAVRQVRAGESIASESVIAALRARD